MKKLYFGTAGIPLSAKAGGSAEGVQQIKGLGLECMEVEFVRGVKMGVDTARKVRDVAAECGVKLSVHAPYYINLNSPDANKCRSSLERIRQSARIGHALGAKNIVFHPAFYMKSRKSTVYTRVKDALTKLLEDLLLEGVRVSFRPETTGKRTQFGAYQELIGLSQEVEGVMPCIDFSHIHSRNGRHNSKEEFREILLEVEKGLGRPALEDMHIHVSGIDFNRKGETRHLNLEDSDLKYQELLEVWREFDIGGLVICESPNLEDDAILLKDIYRGL